MNGAAADQRRARRLPPAALWNKRSPSKRFSGKPDMWPHRRVEGPQLRPGALALAGVERDDRASTSSSSSAAVRAFATLLHAPDSPAFCHALARSPEFAANRRFVARNCSPTRSCTLLRHRRTRVRLPAPPQRQSIHGARTSRSSTRGGDSRLKSGGCPPGCRRSRRADSISGALGIHRRARRGRSKYELRQTVDVDTSKLLVAPPPPSQSALAQGGLKVTT